MKQIHECPLSFTVKPVERRYADNTKNRKNLDMKLVETSCSKSNQREREIRIDEEWEIPWEDLQIGGRIGIGKNYLFPTYSVKLYYYNGSGSHKSIYYMIKRRELELD